MRRARTAVVAMFLLALGTHSGATGGVAPVEFVGTTPCGDAVRAFVGTLASSTPCHSIAWRLAMDEVPGRPSAWTLLASYAVPSPTNPNISAAGPRVTLHGTMESLPATAAGPARVRLRAAGRTAAVTLARIGSSLLHLLDERGQLMIGTAGWSYTLNRADRAEAAADPARAADMSYSISPRATTSVFGIFEGRTPCHGIAREIGLSDDGCVKVKWRVTLFQDSSGAPSTYKIESTLHRRAAREGTWSLVQRAADAPPIYRLAASPSEAAIGLFRASDDVLFFVDRRDQLLVGHADFSYTLNRVAPAVSR